MNADPSRLGPSALFAGAAAPRPADLSSLPDADPARLRLLVADDDPDVLRILCSALQMFQYEVHAAKDGQAAWEALNAGSFDLVITDHMMPRLAGLDLIRKLRRAGHRLPCILISGDLPDLESDPELVLQPMRAVEKPVRLESLIAMVRSLLAEHRQRRAGSSSDGGLLRFCPA